MCGKRIICLIVSVMILIGWSLAQDSLMHPELLSPEALEEYENEGNTSFRISVGEEILYRTKTQFTYKGFEFKYRNEGGEREKNKQQSSLTWVSNNFEFGFGRGQPHIAKGMILGNTMMRFTTGLGGQSGIRPSKIGIKSSLQHKELITLRVFSHHFDLSLFRYDGHYSGIMEIKNKHCLGGIGFYIKEKFIYEGWFDHKRDNIRISVNMSFYGINFNHITGDILYGSGPWKLFGSAVAISKGFQEIKADSKWGSGLKKGNYGFSGGMSYSNSPWKAGCISYVISSTRYHEKQILIDLRYKKKPFELTLSLNYRNIRELRVKESFPFVLDYSESKQAIPKLNVKINVFNQLDLACQLQSDLVHSRSYAALFRLNYEKKDYHIRLQITQSGSDNADLYFIRPLMLSSYTIRKAPKGKTLYIDLLCSKKTERFEVYMLIRTEGINFGINYK